MQVSTIIFALGLVAIAQAAPTSEWEQFKGMHGKFYSSQQEEASRKQIFEDNIARIQAHNQLYLSGLESYSLAMNQFTDMLPEEVVGNSFEFENTEPDAVYVPSGKSLEAVDWRETAGVVTPVKDQGMCGSCWAFSTTGSLEGQMMLKKNTSVSLSESQMVDCSHENYGCNGGLMSLAFRYIKNAGGLESEQSYPYVPRRQSCKFDKSKVVAQVSGYTQIRGGEDHLLDAIAQVGPVSVAVAVNRNFQLYHGGVFNDRYCTHRLNHAILAVGYGHDEALGLDFIIVKNSWGGRWGESGYIRMAAHKDMCGIADMAGYPML